MINQIDYMMSTVAWIGSIVLAGLITFYYGEPIALFFTE